MPQDNLRLKAEQDKVPYLVWQKQGLLETPAGSAVDKTAVLKKLTELDEVLDIQGVAYDRWRIEDLKMLAETAGIKLPQMVPFGQGFKDMSPALDKFETGLLNKELRHPGHQILTWNVANAVVTKDPAGNRKVDKAKATGRVDGVVAAIMAYGSSTGAEKPVKSVYETRGIRVL